MAWTAGIKRRVLETLGRLADGAQNVDVKTLIGTPAHRRLRVGQVRVLFRELTGDEAREAAGEPRWRGRPETIVHAGRPVAAAASPEQGVQAPPVKPRTSCAASSGTSSCGEWPTPSSSTQSAWGSHSLR